MNTINEALAGANSPLEKLEIALKQELTSGKNKLERDFKEAYPVFEQHIARKMRKKMLMEQFNAAYKHQLNLIQFRKLLNTERECRKASGDVMTCATCGQRLFYAKDMAPDCGNGEEA
ncbi:MULTISPECIES: hypothetical protein [Xanthomonas]|uniref:hypothetical protein n=1 Tax=Xanthomonas TaxID=338 RepID=UPI00177C5AC1|nr:MULTISPECIES: hypothetical protein [Xanthomonas]MBD7923088.1 hypothetical protein [Xanthomonas surreyensis]UKE51168.1 hypothetical protein KCU57_01880 [Xanthomonas translucens]